MNALLLYPEIPETFWSFKHALRMIRKRASSPPLGLLTVAGMLPADWNLRLIDLNIDELTDGDLEWANVALLSAMVIQRDSARAAIRRCRDRGVRVIAGGPLFSSEHAEFEEVDHFVLGEAEPSLPALLRDLRSGTARRVYSEPGQADLTDTPVPRWDLVDSRSYSSRNIQYSRGCPHDCDFCSVTELFGHRCRTKSAAQIIVELDSLYDEGWRGTVGFVDDNLIGNKRKLKTELLPTLIAWRRGKWGMPFSTQVTISLADDDELMSLMVRAGFDTVFVGIESLNDESLAECNKRQNENRDMLEDVRRIQRAGLIVQGGFIVGFDHDTPAVFDRLATFIQESGIATAMVGMLQAPAGTRLYRRLKNEGRISDQMSGDNVDGTTNIMPSMGIGPLRKGYSETLASIYSPGNYYARMRTFLREYRPHPVRARLCGWHVLAFFRSIYFLSIVGEERFRYPGLLLWTIFRNPRAFPTAIVMAVSGYHFRKCFASTAP
ncbi:MAG: B12-binding domain-containing radical SAM protein [Candidatus Eisenbacteria bacterium]